MVRIANKISEIPCGQHHRFTLSVFGGGKQEVFWYSTNSGIACINVKTGELTARGEGKVKIWAADRFGRIWDEVLLLVRRGLTREETEAFYVPYGVERIAGRAFEGAKWLQKIVLPNTVKAIGAGAFMDCHALKEIVIPESVTEFEDNDYVGAIDAGSDLVEMGLKETFVIVTPKGSAAETYAIEHGIAYRNE